MTVAAGSYWSNLMAITPYRHETDSSATAWAYTHCALLASPLYRTYAKLYDQVKVDSVYIKLSLMTNVGNGGLVPALKFYTAWDRNSTFAETSGTDIPTVSDLMNGSESQATLVVNNSRAVFTRYSRASDIQERTTFHDCSYSIINTTNYVDNSYRSASNVVPQIGYCPGLWFAIQSAVAPGTGNTFSFLVSADVKWRVTFRNPKYGLSSGVSKGDVREIEVPETDFVVPEVDEMKEPEDEKVVVKKKVKIAEPVYEEEVLEDDKDDIDDDDDEESQVPLTQPVKVKKAGKKSST